VILLRFSVLLDFSGTGSVGIFQRFSNR